MRYALRSQGKIKKVLGEDFLNSLVNSLNVVFTGSISDKIEASSINRVLSNGEDKKETVVLVKDINDRKKVHRFVIIKINYDVYNLAYYDTR